MDTNKSITILFSIVIVLIVGLGMWDKLTTPEPVSVVAVVSTPEPVLNAVAKTVVALTDGPSVLKILEFRGDSVIVEINGADTVAYKVR